MYLCLVTYVIHSLNHYNALPTHQYWLLPHPTTRPTPTPLDKRSSLYGGSQIDSWADSDLYRHDDIDTIDPPADRDLIYSSHDLYSEDYSKLSRQVYMRPWQYLLCYTLYNIYIYISDLYMIEYLYQNDLTILFYYLLFL